MDKNIIKKLKELNLNKRRFKKHISKFCNSALRYWIVKFIYTKKDVYYIDHIKNTINNFFNARGVNE